MVVKITVPAAVPEEDRAKVNNVIPLSLLLGCNHKSRRLIKIVFTQKMWCVCPQLDYASLPFIKSFLHIKATVGSNTQQKGLSTRRSMNVLQRCPSLNYISGNSGGWHWVSKDYQWIPSSSQVEGRVSMMALTVNLSLRGFVCGCTYGCLATDSSWLSNNWQRIRAVPPHLRRKVMWNKEEQRDKDDHNFWRWKHK